MALQVYAEGEDDDQGLAVVHKVITQLQQLLPHTRKTASALTFELRRADGKLADPPTLTTVAPSWQAGDTIPLGCRTLRVIEVRDGEPDERQVLVVEDMSA